MMKNKTAAGLFLLLCLLPAVGRAGEATAEKKVKPVEIEQKETFQHWVVTPFYDYSFFNKGRESWQEEDVQILYRFNKYFLVGGEIDIMQRPPSGTDIFYSALASWFPWKFLELHGKMSFCPQPNFSPKQIYSGGLEYQVLPRVALLFDYQQLNFASTSYASGALEQIKPGVSIWLTDDIFFTFRYARGWAFQQITYNYYSGTLNIGNMPGGGRMTLGFAYGTDPDLDFGTLQTSISNAYIYSFSYTQPVSRNLSIFAGIQYVYRLKQFGNEELYQQLTPTIGCTLKF